MAPIIHSEYNVCSQRYWRVWFWPKLNSDIVIFGLLWKLFFATITFGLLGSGVSFQLLNTALVTPKQNMQLGQNPCLEPSIIRHLVNEPAHPVHDAVYIDRCVVLIG